MYIDLPVVVLTDSTAAKGLGTRNGHGKAKHIATRLLWLQGCIRRKELTVEKASTEANTADMHTKALDAVRLEKLMNSSGQTAMTGRAEHAPNVAINLTEVNTATPLRESELELQRR